MIPLLSWVSKTIAFMPSITRGKRKGERRLPWHTHFLVLNLLGNDPLTRTKGVEKDMQALIPMLETMCKEPKNKYIFVRI